jgi:hypothetical protein
LKCLSQDNSGIEDDRVTQPCNEDTGSSDSVLRPASVSIPSPPTNVSSRVKSSYKTPVPAPNKVKGKSFRRNQKLKVVNISGSEDGSLGPQGEISLSTGPQCEICSRVFGDTKELDLHRMSHNGERYVKHKKGFLCGGESFSSAQYWLLIF